jgi:hypothetical protein
MSGFAALALDSLRAKAGLQELPPFLRVGGEQRDIDEDRSAYVDSAYYSPAALRWADYAMDHLPGLRSTDVELLGLIWKAMRLGKGPSKQQLKNERDIQMFLYMEKQKEQVRLRYFYEMGAPSGPDDEQPDDFVPPEVPWRSPEEMLFEQMGREFGIAPETVQAYYYRCRRKYMSLEATE